MFDVFDICDRYEVRAYHQEKTSKENTKNIKKWPKSKNKCCIKNRSAEITSIIRGSSLNRDFMVYLKAVFRQI